MEILRYSDNLLSGAVSQFYEYLMTETFLS